MILAWAKVFFYAESSSDELSDELTFRDTAMTFVVVVVVVIVDVAAKASEAKKEIFGEKNKKQFGWLKLSQKPFFWEKCWSKKN